jgi:hypothetical protein
VVSDLWETQVARIRLYVEQSVRVAAQTVLDASGGQFSIPFLRVFSYLRVGLRKPLVQECIIDIGAPLSVFPLVHWRRFASEIEWLTPTAVGPSWLTGFSGRTGGSSPCRAGRVHVAAFDRERPSNQLAPVPIIALFEQAQNPDDRILIGLHASILTGRVLTLDEERRDGWLEDR